MFVERLSIICLVASAISSQRISPCPDIFTYTTGTSEEGKWYGQINLQSDVELAGVWVRVKLNTPVEGLVNWFGESTTNDNQEFTIKNPQYKLEPGPPVSLRFYVKYDTVQPEPYLTKITLNGRSICTITGATQDEATSRPFVSKKVTEPNSANIYRGNDMQSLVGNDYFPGDFPLLGPQNSDGSGRPSVQLQVPSAQCGTVTKKAAPLITLGLSTKEGEWPWHIAIYRSEGIQLTYICGGNLLSKKFVLTAAHCVTKPHTTKPSNVQGLLLYLGAHNLRNFGPGIQVLQISDVIVHPDYDSTYYHNDLALLKMSRNADITDFVRPICLWEGDTSLDSIVGKLGTVVGWGFDETKKVSEELMQAKMPVVSTSTCIYSNRDFFSRFTSETSYCAGFKNGTSVCNGDSGGGMTFARDDTKFNNKVWHLRGLVSVSLPLQGEIACDPMHYVVFTDVAKHLDWIKDEMKK